VARVKEGVLEWPADVFGALSGNVVDDFAREKSDVEATLVLTFPVVVLWLAVDDDDGVAGSHLLKVVQI